jgi:hypothetical protein
MDNYGILAFAGKTCYVNGIKQANSIANKTNGVYPQPFVIGAESFTDISPTYPFRAISVKIQALAIYNVTLADAQILAITNNMNAL